MKTLYTVEVGIKDSNLYDIVSFNTLQEAVDFAKSLPMVDPNLPYTINCVKYDESKSYK